MKKVGIVGAGYVGSTAAYALGRGVRGTSLSLEGGYQMESEISQAAPVLVSDFDGTMTRHDFYELAIERHLPASTPDYWAAAP